MAQIQGRLRYEHMSWAERQVYEFIVKKMPDYIYAVFDLVLDDFEYDTILLVPHMGVFVLEIRGGTGIYFENGDFYIDDMGRRKRSKAPERSKEARWRLQRWFRERFNLTPIIHELLCFPGLVLNAETERMVREKQLLDLDHILWAQDFYDEYALISKLGNFSTYRIRQLQKLSSGELYYDDLTDDLVSIISAKWTGDDVEFARPTNPPILFMSYSRLNQYRALILKTHIEKQGIYVWRAPEDVPLGEHYLEAEMAAIHKCDYFLLLLSEASQESVEVRKEVEAAQTEGKNIFAIRLGEFEVNPYYLAVLEKSQYRTIDADKTEEKGVRPPTETELQVIREITRLLR